MKMTQPPENILEIITAEIDRQIRNQGFAIRWEVYHAIEPETHIMRNHFRKIWKNWIGSGKLGYVYRRPDPAERDRMEGSRVWVAVKSPERQK